MIDAVSRFWNWIWITLPPVSRRTRPNLACLIGFVLGGVGLAIYFRTVIDFIVPIALAIVAVLVTVKMVGADVDLGWLPGAIIAALYGYLRSLKSNAQQAQSTGAVIPVHQANVSPSSVLAQVAQS